MPSHLLFAKFVYSVPELDIGSMDLDMCPGKLDPWVRILL